MFRKQINSQVIDRASVRLEGIKAISETLDLGNGISVASFTARLEDARSKANSYNQYLSVLEEKQAAFEDAENLLADFTGRVLAAVGVKYGKDSIEYTQAGGIRLRDRKRRPRKSRSNTVVQG